MTILSWILFILTILQFYLYGSKDKPSLYKIAPHTGCLASIIWLIYGLNLKEVGVGLVALAIVTFIMHAINLARNNKCD